MCTYSLSKNNQCTNICVEAAAMCKEKLSYLSVFPQRLLWMSDRRQIRERYTALLLLSSTCQKVPSLEKHKRAGSKAEAVGQENV